MLVFLPIGDEVARLPQEWFLTTPVLWLGALVLISTIRGPLRNAPIFIKKLLSLAAASLIALGLLFALVWEPVIKASKASPVFTALWILLLVDVRPLQRQDFADAKSQTLRDNHHGAVGFREELEN